MQQWGTALHSGLVALTGHSELENCVSVYRVGVHCGVVEMGPVHCCSHKDLKKEFLHR